ncbi:MAG: hypothetical protein GQ557_02630 [Mycoplasmataceae bacterium]|nr:hypothetical protein [Mycoplasmataceae bacterium]
MTNTNGNFKKVTFVGTGAFGTAIAQSIINNCEQIILYGIDQGEIEDINSNHQNSKYYDNKLSKKIIATSDSHYAFIDADVIFFALPSPLIEKTLKDIIIPNMNQPAYFINLSKGFDYYNKKLLNHLIELVVPNELNLGVLKLSGPSFAVEVINQEFTSFCLACKDIEIAKKMSKLFISDNFKIMIDDDIKGIEIVSILKNSYALILGIASGLGYKSNTISYLFTQVYEEMTILLKLLNNNNDGAMHSVAGLGDLYLTGSSPKSRNFATGQNIGINDKINDKIISKYATVEGIKSIEIINNLKNKHNLKLELFDVLNNIISLKQKPSATVKKYLMI